MNKNHQNNNSAIISSFNKIARIFKLSSMKESLEQSNSFISMALKGSEFGKWDWDMSSDEVNLSPDAQLILGYDRQEKILQQKYLLDLIHPEDRFKFLDEIERHKKGITDFVNIEIRMKSAYDQWNWINMRGKIVEFDTDGSPHKFTGINYDINEQKQYDKEVRELQLKVLHSQEKEVTEREPVTQINGNMDRYSQFRLNGLRDLLEYN